jgi:hypothetical protein
VPSSGQRWTTAAELASAGHRSDVREVEPGLLGIGVDPPVAIGQRALVIQTGRRRTSADHVADRAASVSRRRAKVYLAMVFRQIFRHGWGLRREGRLHRKTHGS